MLREEIRVKFLGIGVDQRPKLDQTTEYYVPLDDLVLKPEIVKSCFAEIAVTFSKTAALC